jgi:uncharacterized protein YjiS (DUF1127 family)
MHDMTLSVATGTMHRPFGLWHRVLQALARWRREQRIIATLESMDDALLKDIGICRCEILRVARDGSADPRSW